MADIFVSYTSSDRDWAEWIGQELEKLGHTAHLHDWEISGGGNIMAWMEERHNKADQVLCVVSGHYLEQPYSALERHGAQWATASKRPNFLLPVFVESCEAPTLLAPLKRCDLYGLNEDVARARLAVFMMPAVRPTGPMPFPGTAKSATVSAKASVTFPGEPRALSNIRISVPRYFLGRDEVLAKIKIALAADKGRVAITALYGLRGVGKTTLAAAYAEKHSSNYRATWWIRAETEPTMRADIVDLGIQLGWVAAEEKEEPALAKMMGRLRHEGEDVLLIFDNAIDADSVEPYFPIGGGVHVLVTSNANAWRDLASPLQIDTWPEAIGADYLVSRTGLHAERAVALSLSKTLGGLPLAHEQAAAYCERLEVPFATYLKRYDEAPVRMLNDPRDAPRAYHNRLTVAKTFALAIDEAAKLHPAAEPLIVYAALLAPEPIPLYLFLEECGTFGEPLASTLADDGLDEAIAALLAFALIDRESIFDARNPAKSVDAIRLHQLVRQVAAARREGEQLDEARRQLIGALVKIYPGDVDENPETWARARQLDALAMELVRDDAALPKGTGEQVVFLLNQLGMYRLGPLAAYAEARVLLERSLATSEGVHGVDHPDTVTSLNNLAAWLDTTGDFAGAQPLYERALRIREKALGPDHLSTARSVNNLGYILRVQGDLVGAIVHYERALAIREKVLGPNHPTTARSLNNVALAVRLRGDVTKAQQYYERALAINEAALGFDHPVTAVSLNNLGTVFQEQGELSKAFSFFERALAITERVFGPDHPNTAFSLINFAFMLKDQSDVADALPYLERALKIYEDVLGPKHPDTKQTASDVVSILEALGRKHQADGLRAKYDI